MKRFVLIALALGAFTMPACSDSGGGNGGGPMVGPDVSFDAQVNKQDVIPINGDSSDPVDEVMDDAPSAHPAAFHHWAFSAPDAAPVAIYVKRDDGDVDVEVISPDAADPRVFQQRISAPVVLAPLTESSRAAVERYLASRRGSGAHLTRARLHAYCVEANKPAAAARTIYAIAPRRIADRFASVQGLLRVADHAVADGILKPQGDPRAYGRFIAQYAAWTSLEHWDQKTFTEQFVARTRATAEARHQTWSTETEQTLRALAPNRWADIERVTQAAESTTGGGSR